MDLNAVPTKGNLIAAKNSLALAKQGFELMDKKRNILVREIMDLNAKAKDIQDSSVRSRSIHCFRKSKYQNWNQKC